MKRLIVFKTAITISCAPLMVAAFALAPAVAEVADLLGVPGPIQFNGTDFGLAWSSAPKPGYIKQEFVPADQTAETYNQMLLIERLAGEVTPMKAAQTQAAVLQERKASDPLVNMDLVQNPQSGEVLLDFLVSTQDASGTAIIEWNAYRYAPAPVGKRGIMLLGISHRAYGAQNAKAFLGQMKTVRPGQINALARADLPAVR